jgi:type I restriction enzyme S subunit
MTLNEFFKKFHVISDMPDAVGRMRSLVLRLAVRGRLVPQNPADDDADCLLHDIAKSRARTIEEREVPPANQWHEVPSSWRWVRLGSIGEIVGGGTPRSDNPAYFSDTKGVPWLTPADLNGFSEKQIFRGRRFITPLGLAESSAQLLPEGSVLFSSRAPIGYVAIAGNELATNQGFKTCVPFVRQTNEYLYYYLMNAAARIDSEASGTTFREVSGKLVAQIPVALPPLAEQNRIVAKVDELMAWCDRLEAQQQERDTRHAALARASLARFADAPTPANLTFLFHKSYTIPPADIRKSILTLAVQGKLVPQDLTESRVSASLKTARNNASTSPPVLNRVEDKEIPFEIPTTWRWVTVADVAATRLGKMLDKEKNRGEAHPYLRNTNVHWFRFELDSIKTMRFERSELAEYRVEPGDVLICEGGHGIARAAVWRGDILNVMFQKALHRVRPLPELNGHFLTFCLWVFERYDLLQRYFTGAGIPHFTGKSLAKVCIPLPPLGEQDRIVAKVHQLMALVERLETQLAASSATAAKLLDAVVGELTA